MEIQDKILQSIKIYDQLANDNQIDSKLAEVKFVLSLLHEKLPDIFQFKYTTSMHSFPVFTELKEAVEILTKLEITSKDECKVKSY